MTKITTIILDLGGVILNLNQNLTIEQFKSLGVSSLNLHANHTVFAEFEIGKISSKEFVNTIRASTAKPITDAEIINAWNAMLLDLPQKRIEYIKKLREKYTVLLLSNTNSIHIDAFNKYFETTFNNLNWYDLFDKVYYSYEIGMRKPNTDIYSYVLNQHQLQPKQTLFVDDNEQNLLGASQVGINTLLANIPLDETLFEQVLKVCNS